MVTEAVFSMDGDSPDVKEMNTIIRRYGAHLILDEAHSIGVVGDLGGGLAQELSLRCSQGLSLLESTRLPRSGYFRIRKAKTVFGKLFS